MRECLVTVLEDVLIGTDDVPMDRHLAMWRAMSSEFTTVLLTTWNRDHARRVAHLNHLRYDLLMDKGDSALPDTAWKVYAVTEVLSMGWAIGFYWDVDPVAVREVLAMGQSTLLLSHRVLRPSWLPSDGPPRAWEDLVAFHDSQRAATADRTPSGSGAAEVGGGGRGWIVSNAE